MAFEYKKIFSDGWKVTVEKGWTVIYNEKNEEITRVLTSCFFNNPYGYNCSSRDDMAEIVHKFWTE